MSFEKEKRSNEALRVRKESLKGQRKCTIGCAQWAQWHNRAEILAVMPNFLKLCTGSARSWACQCLGCMGTRASKHDRIFRDFAILK